MIFEPRRSSLSNVFMTLAWYGHLRNLCERNGSFAVLLSWGNALFEYIFMIPANRIGRQS